MCIGIAIIILVPEDGTPIKIYGKNDNSSHDGVLHEFVPVEMHNRVAKIEYTYPHSLRLDAPDEECRKSATDLGIVEVGPLGVRLLPHIVEMVHKWIATEQIDFTRKTLQEANLEGANLQRADLRGANLKRADLDGANLEGALGYNAPRGGGALSDHR